MVDPAAWGDHQFALPLKQLITLCSDTKSIKNNLIDFPHLCYKRYIYIYRVIQEEAAVLWEMIVCVILSKKVHTNMGPILNGYRDMVKRRYGPSCEHEQQLRNK